MYLEWIIKGLVLGLSIAAPVGPICMICIKKTLNNGPVAGLSAGLGAASADAIYGLLAGLGLTSISSFLIDYSSLFQWVGGLFICYLGVRTMFLQSVVTGVTPTKQSMLSSYLTTFLLTLSNPMTILFFLGIFTATSVTLSDVDVLGMPLLVTGVFVGSLLWWVSLVGTITLIRIKKLNSSMLQIVNRLSGVILFVFGLWTLLHP
ncbi:threonine/homoserine/homoserine lactone efflux protein [Paenibacillus sp. DS2015]|uniref:LysE family translocator n=1 Tax=Paenibacillus sp. DS2015 TaxID=3373917 RepID=UPI003D24D20B